jgi:hypothetical protein
MGRFLDPENPVFWILNSVAEPLADVGCQKSFGALTADIEIRAL